MPKNHSECATRVLQKPKKEKDEKQDRKKNGKAPPGQKPSTAPAGGKGAAGGKRPTYADKSNILQGCGFQEMPLAVQAELQLLAMQQRHAHMWVRGRKDLVPSAV